MHKLGVVHRGLKPWNIAIDANGVLKTLDYGLASSVQRQLTTENTTLYVYSLLMLAKPKV